VSGAEAREEPAILTLREALERVFELRHDPALGHAVWVCRGSDPVVPVSPHYQDRTEAGRDLHVLLDAILIEARRVRHEACGCRRPEGTGRQCALEHLKVLGIQTAEAADLACRYPCWCRRCHPREEGAL
jgi:hypothetical protein